MTRASYRVIPMIYLNVLRHSVHSFCLSSKSFPVASYCIPMTGTMLSRKTRYIATTKLLLSSSEEEMNPILTMENIYLEWSIEEDRILSENMNESTPVLAAKLGRGLRGVEERRKKILNVNSSAYERLFVRNGTTERIENLKKDALTPAKDILQRIQWDASLDKTMFTIGYFDRMENKVLYVPFDAKNESVSGKEQRFVFAIPEHRIQTVIYRERIVWEKSTRLDLMFGTVNGNGETIDQVIASYDEWKENDVRIKEYNRKRQMEVASNIKQLLGEELFVSLKELSAVLQENAKFRDISITEIEAYIQDALNIFRTARRVASNLISEHTPQSDAECLDRFSELISLLPNEQLRENILTGLYKQITSLKPLQLQEIKLINSSNQLPILDENDLSETFVRGSGAGGQKINKTANKVVLVHIPTNIRVECQDTRSLQQNRKIARKRLTLKVDEVLNGRESKVQQTISKKIEKKQKSKARNQSRLRKKLEAKSKSQDVSEDEEDIHSV